MTFTTDQSTIFIIGFLVLWDLVWKGIALWRSARARQPVWFVFLLIINSAGLLPIIYILISEQRELDENGEYLEEDVKSVRSKDVVEK